MKIVFVESFRKKEWNGYTARYTEGVSGTHTNIIYLAEGLATLGHDITVVELKSEIFEPKWINGVYYECFETLSDNQIYDIIVFTFCLEDTVFLSKVKLYSKVIFIMGCPKLAPTLKYTDVNFMELFRNNDRAVSFGFVSENSKINAFNFRYGLQNFRHHLLYNCIDVRDFTDINGELYTYEKKENNFVFFACIERGLNIVKEIAKRTETPFRIVSSNYDKKEYDKDDKYETLFITPECNSKQSIMEWNRKSKYFIYPLIDTTTNRIHYDTFGYVVLESLLCGVIVIAPRMKIFEELYGDAICYVDTSNIGISQEDLTFGTWYEKSTNMIWLKNNANFGFPLIERYVEMVNRLENNEEMRKTYIQRGFALKNKFSNDKIANSFINFMEYNM